MGQTDKSLHATKKRSKTMMFFDILAIGKKVPRTSYDDHNFFEIFEKLFKKKVEELFKLNMEKYDKQMAKPADMFEFTKRKIQEIEDKIYQQFSNEKKIKGLPVTKLNNQAAVKSIADVQKELLSGNYEF